MKHSILSILLLTITTLANSQKIESIAFNLYTDSLKKTVHNYISVDGKLSNGKYMPLTNNQHITLSSSYGKWQGNDLIIDTSYKKDSVVITAALIANTNITQSITVYLKKSLFEGQLKTEAEILKELEQPKKKK